MLVHEVTGADAFFGSHADGRVQKAPDSCFPVSLIFQVNRRVCQAYPIALASLKYFVQC